MILDPRPKTRREELYGRDSELRAVESIIIRNKMPVTLITGLKRIGKTSLALVAINDMAGDDNYRFVYIESWRLEKRGQLGAILARSLGVEPSEDPVKVLEKTRGTGRYTFIVLDEPQQAPRRVRREFPKLAEAITLTIRHASLIVVSSAPGLALDAIGFGGPGAEQGRSTDYTVWLGPLPRDEAEALLMDGLREQGVSPEPETVRDAVEFFEGVPGWLVFFGQRLLAGMKPEQIYREAIQVALEEIRSLAPRPQLLLKVLAEGHNSWTEALQALEDLEDRIVSRNGFAKALHYLEKRALVKDYQVLDPVYRRAARILDPREPLAQLGLAPLPEA